MRRSLHAVIQVVQEISKRRESGRPCSRNGVVVDEAEQEVVVPVDPEVRNTFQPPMLETLIVTTS